MYAAEESLLTIKPEDKYKQSKDLLQYSRIIIVGETGVGKSTLFVNFVADNNNKVDTVIQNRESQLQEKAHQFTNQAFKQQILESKAPLSIVNLQNSMFGTQQVKKNTERQQVPILKVLQQIHIKRLGCQAVLIVFDVTDKNSLEQALDVWLPLTREKTDNAVTVLVANKSDLGKQPEAFLQLVQERVLDRASNEKLAGKENIFYHETAALNGTGVQELFERVGKEIKSVLDIGQKQQTQANINGLRDYTGQAQIIKNRNDSFHLNDTESVEKRNIKPQSQKKTQKLTCAC